MWSQSPCVKGMPYENACSAAVYLDPNLYMMSNLNNLLSSGRVTAKSISEQGLFNNPPQEREWFNARASNQLVIYYDQESTEMNTPALINLFRALHDLEFERPLQKRPVLLVGGFSAWLECSGMKWVEGHDVDAALKMDVVDVALRMEVADPTFSATPPSSTMSTWTNGSFDPARPASTPIPTDHQPQNHAIFTKLAQGGGINRHDGRIIKRTIGDTVRSRLLRCYFAPWLLSHC